MRLPDSARCLRGGGCRLETGADAPAPHLASRTALLMPTYNEQPARVMAGLQAIWESLRRLGAADAFDMFILSDTTDPDIWIAEEAGFLALRERTGGHARIFYRRRPKNVARKAGNIADWVTRFGGAYAQFLILDADSLMTGETLVRLVGAMERASRCRADPDAADHHRRARPCSPACSSSPAASMGR